jgi:hypothetical protein
MSPVQRLDDQIAAAVLEVNDEAVGLPSAPRRNLADGPLRFDSPLGNTLRASRARMPLTVDRQRVWAEPGVTHRRGKTQNAPGGTRVRAMVLSGDDAQWAELDAFVRAYELAYARDREARFTDFLPQSDHPLYRAVLRELVRVDLEYSWEQGCPKSLDHYLEARPDLKGDPESLRAIISEEFRLRCRAGDQPSSKEYVRRFGKRVAGDLDRWWAEGASGGSFLRRAASERRHTGLPAVDEDAVAPTGHEETP